MELIFIDDIGLFLLTVVIISTTGVMMPGPVTAAAIAKGYKDKWAGGHIALGHAAVELPTIALIALGFSTVLNDIRVAIVIGLAGGTMLFYMGVSMITSRQGVVATLKKDMKVKGKKGEGDHEADGKGPFPYHPFIAGVITTASNPYYFLWWATLGAFLTMNALELGLVVLLVFAVLHWSIDLGWDVLLSYTVNKSKRFWDQRTYVIIFAICGLIMMIFGVWFVASAVSNVLSLR